MKPFRTFILAIIVPAILSCQPSKETAKPPVRVSPVVKQLTGEVLAPLSGPVTLEITLGDDGDSMAEETTALVEYIGSVSEKVSVTRLNLVSHYNPEGLGVTHGPVIEMKGTAPGILRYYGFPERKEIRPFLEGLLFASGQHIEMPPDVEAYIKALDEEIVIRIFTTPD